MRRKVKVRLTRRQGKRLRSVTVTVYQVTLGGFIEALRAAGESVMRYRETVRPGAPALSQEDVWLALSHPDVCCSVADVLCPDQPRDWYRPWHSKDNHFRMLDAARKTSDWDRLIKQIQFPGAEGQPAATARRKRGGTLYSDALLLGQIIHVNPQEIIDVWPMERFLDLCEAVIRDTEAAQEEERYSDPTWDPEAKPTPIVVPPGRGKVWVN